MDIYAAVHIKMSWDFKERPWAFKLYAHMKVIYKIRVPLMGSMRTNMGYFKKILLVLQEQLIFRLCTLPLPLPNFGTVFQDLEDIY